MTNQKHPLEAVAEALEELRDLMDDVRHGEYTPDSFTAQPATEALTTLRDYIANEPKVEGLSEAFERFYSNDHKMAVNFMRDKNGDYLSDHQNDCWKSFQAGQAAKQQLKRQENKHD